MLFALNKSRRRKRRGGRSKARKSSRRRRASWTLRCRRANGRRRHRGFNPSLSGVTAGFNTNLVGKAAVVVGGSLANNLLTGALARMIPIQAVKSGIGSYALGLVSAGLVGMGAKAVVPSQAGLLFFGSVLDVVTRIAGRYLVPMLPSPKMAGLGNWLTPMDVANARPLSGFDDDLDGLDDYATMAAVSAPNMTALAGMGYTGDMAEAEELSGY